MMPTPKIMTVHGTRPEAIKIAPIIKALRKDSRFEIFSVSTGQHKEMLDQVNKMFDIDPLYDLGLMKQEQSLNSFLSRAIKGLDEIIAVEKPDAVVVHGDTTSALAGGLAGFHQGLRVIHLEAGLRTGDLDSPFPEEANRKIIAQLANLHLAPTKGALENLRREDIHPNTIAVTGNTVIDALLEAAAWDTKFSSSVLADIVASDARIVVVTTHRRENLDAMKQIGLAVREIAQLYPEVNFILPLHLNPRVRAIVVPEVSECSNVFVFDPLPYDQFTKLLDRSSLVLTDSGGVQEEAPALGKPVLVMRENTERPEAVVAGTVKLVGTERALIVAETKLLLDDAAVYHSMSNATNPYGDGRAAVRCVEAIASVFGLGEKMPDFTA